MTTPLEKFIEQQTADFQPLYTQIGELQWLAATTGKPEFDAQLNTAIQQLRLLMADKQRLEALDGYIKKEGRSMTTRNDQLVQRQARLLHDGFRANQFSAEHISQITALEIEVQSQFNKFRATVAGQAVTDNDLKTILKESDDTQLRQEAWEASKQVGAQVADTVRSLAKIRNAAARAAGFGNFYSMRLETDELDEAELFALLDELKRGIDPAWQRYKADLDQQLAKRFRTRTQDLRPWHYADPFFQEGQPSDVDLDQYFAGQDLEQLTRQYFSAIGLEIDDILQRSDLYEREGKNQHAFCTHIDRAGDIRVLCNNRPNARWMETMLHEFGHAVYDKYLDMSLPYILRAPAHTLTTEAIAILSGDLVNDAAWLAHYVGVDTAEASVIENKLTEDKRTGRLIFARWVFVMAHFERAMYADPDQDLNALWWRLVAEFQGVHQPDQLAGTEWASKIHIGIAPVYYHNYLLGAMIAAQLQEHMVQHVVGGSHAGYVSDPRIGTFMREKLFKSGATQDWRGWLHGATGKNLSAAAYVKRLS
jgi:peptidyl-dipeptidase A